MLRLAGWTPVRDNQHAVAKEVNAELLISYTILAIAVFAGNGRLTSPLLALAALGAFMVLSRVLRRPGTPGRRYLPVLLLGSWALALLRPPDVTRWNGTLSVGPVLLLLLAYYAFGLAIALVAIVALRRGRADAWPLAAILACYAASGALLLYLVPSPRIDVFWLQQAGARELLAGRNPYGLTIPNLYTPSETVEFFGDQRSMLVNYPYPPLSLIATTISWHISGDVRVAYLLLQVLGALLLERLARRFHPPAVSLAVAALWLLYPRGLFVLEQSWTEPLALTAWVAFMAARSRAVTTGVLLAAKQYTLLLLPLFRPPRRYLVAGLAFAALLMLPFFLWNPRAFLNDVVWFQIRQPFRTDALSLPALLYWLTGWRAPGAAAALGYVGALIYVQYVCRLRDASPRVLSQAAAVVSFAFFLCAKQAFCNYYYYVGGMILTAVATDPI
jgi:hypothetical protein